MKLRKGDTVQVIAGTSKGKTGKVLRVDQEASRITVEGINLRVKHSRPRRQGQTGQKLELPAAFHISNVMLMCPKCGKPTRVGLSGQGQKGKKRICKQCDQTLD